MMKFRCPQCQTGYELPLAALPVPGDDKTPYKLKCVRCKCIFLMTVELATPDEESKANEDVYFELISPNSILDADSTDPVISTEGKQHVRFEFRPSPEKEDALGPTVRRASSWGQGVTLDLTEYEIGAFRRAARRKAMIAGILVGVFLGFLLYVAGMNNWSISINRLDRDIKHAFFLQSNDEIKADLLAQMRVTFNKGYTLRVSRGRMVGIIRGEIQNNTPSSVGHVLLKGRILDADRKVVSSVTIPCGVKLADWRLKKMRASRIPNLYKRKGKLFNCEIKSGYSTAFNVIFHELPRYFDSTYIFQVHPHSAESVE